MSIAFPEPAARMNLNDRGHWRRRHRLSQAWRTAAWVAACAQLGATPAARRRPACLVIVVFPVADPGRRRDPSNWMPTVKPIVDGLVDAGVWPDDNADWVTVIEPRFQHRDVLDDRVLVRLAPRADMPALL